MNDNKPVQEAVRERYAKAALQVAQEGVSSCCSTPAACGAESADPITSGLYSENETAVLPETAVAASLGCGNPTAMAELKPGETVLDLAAAAASTCCCRLAVSDRRAKPTVLT